MKGLGWLFKVHIFREGTKFCEISSLLLTVCTAFSEYLNFKKNQVNTKILLFNGTFHNAFTQPFKYWTYMKISFDFM